MSWRYKDYTYIAPKPTTLELQARKAAHRRAYQEALSIRRRVRELQEAFTACGEYRLLGEALNGTNPSAAYVDECIELCNEREPEGWDVAMVARVYALCATRIQD